MTCDWDDWPEPSVHDDALDRADQLASIGWHDPLDFDPLLDEERPSPYWEDDLEW